MRYACKKHEERKRQCKTIFIGDMILYKENPKESTPKKKKKIQKTPLRTK